MEVNATDLVYNEVLKRILTLEYSPGSIISRPDLIEQLGVSRTPVREALKLLEKEGLVVIKAKSKTVVSKINLDEVKETNFLRIALETEVVRQMIINYNESAVNRLEDCLNRQKLILKNMLNIDKFYELDKEFHKIMYESIGQKRLNDLLNSKMVHKIRARRLELPKEGKIESVYNQHLDILNAIKKKDLQSADEAVRMHLTGTVSNLEALKEEKPYFFD